MEDQDEHEYTAFESFDIIAKDGTQLHAVSWNVEHPVGVICLVHGLGEHSGRYDHVAKFFNDNKMSVYAFDHRGHGKSKGKRGHMPHQDAVLDDVEDLLKSARAEHNDAPIVLYGHSFGGNIVANYILKRNTNELRVAILSSSWLRLAKDPPSWQLILARVMVRLLPSFTQSNGLATSYLSKDPEVVKAYEEDPLVHDKISAKLFFETYHSGIWAIEHAPSLKIPTLVFHGDADQITSPEGSSAFHANNTNLTTLKIWEGVMHEPHNDVEQKEVLNFTLEWINGHF